MKNVTQVCNHVSPMDIAVAKRLVNEALERDNTLTIIFVNRYEELEPTSVEDDKTGENYVRLREELPNPFFEVVTVNSSSKQLFAKYDEYWVRDGLVGDEFDDLLKEAIAEAFSEHQRFYAKRVK